MKGALNRYFICFYHSDNLLLAHSLNAEEKC
jgi:hypothetical protein